MGLFIDTFSLISHQHLKTDKYNDIDPKFCNRGLLFLHEIRNALDNLLAENFPYILFLFSFSVRNTSKTNAQVYSFDAPISVEKMK